MAQEQVSQVSMTITGVYGMFGNIANAPADCVLGVQLKYEF